MTLSFYRGMEKHPRERKSLINLVNILKDDPAFGTCFSEVRLSLQTSDFFEDERIGQILLHLSAVETFALRVKKDVGDWLQVNNASRQAVEGIIRSPTLKTLTLGSLKVPWSTFLALRPTLEKLVLNAVSASEDVSITQDPRPSFITAIQTINAGPYTLTHLINAKKPDHTGTHAVDFAQLRTWTTTLAGPYAMSIVRNILDHTKHLQHLTLSCACEFVVVLSILEYTDRFSDGDIKGLFSEPHAPSLYSLQSLEFFSDYIFQLAFLHLIANELGSLPKGNNIKKITISRISYPSYPDSVQQRNRNEEDWRALLAPLTPEAFPHLETVIINANVVIVNVCSGPGTDRILNDLRQLGVIFGGEGRHYEFKMYARERHILI